MPASQSVPTVLVLVLAAARGATAHMEESGATSPAAVEDPGNVLLAPSGRFAILAMDRPGKKADLFISCRAGSEWTEPHALSDVVNSKYADFAPAIDAAERTLYFTSERPGVVGVLPDSVRPPGDIYRAGAALAGLNCP